MVFFRNICTQNDAEGRGQKPVSCGEAQKASLHECLVLQANKKLAGTSFGSAREDKNHREEQKKTGRAPG